MNRISREDYFMEIAKITAKRGTCDRAFVGAVAVKNHRVIMSAYNGSPSNMEHCSDIGHKMHNNHCIRTVHAEMNIITQCAKEGISLKDSEIYVTHQPCYHCLKHLISAGIKRVWFLEGKPDDRSDTEIYRWIDVIHLLSKTAVNVRKLE